MDKASKHSDIATKSDITGLNPMLNTKKLLIMVSNDFIKTLAAEVTDEDGNTIMSCRKELESMMMEQLYF